MIGLGITLALLAALLVYFVGIYNGLVGLRENIKVAWSNIDVLLKQRHDELPKLIETCKRYMQFEQETLERVMRARTSVVEASTSGNIAAVGTAEQQLRSGVTRLFAVAESYPNLKSDETFKQLQTRITALEMVLGLNLAGAFKAILAGCTLTILGSLIAGLGSSFEPARILQWFLLICATSFAFNGMMFLLMVRVEDPLVPRAMFGILNTLLYFPSGAIYPVQAFPKWLQVISYIDPFSYAVHGLKATLLKEASWVAVSHDVLYLSLFGFISLAISAMLFKRTL